MDATYTRTMNQSIIDPPPPPNGPPPQQSRRARSRRLRSDRSLSSNIQNCSEAAVSPLQTTRCQEENDVSASARTLPHQNTENLYNNNRRGELATQQEEAKTALHALELDNVVPDRHFSKFPHMLPWSKHPLDVGMDGIMGGIPSEDSSVEGMYYGDVMSSFPLDDADSNNFSTDSTNGTSQTTRVQRMRKSVADSLRLSFSLKSTQSVEETDDDNESLSDFKDWTPPDSAYGAAFPICGWVPKHYRRLIEASIIGLFLFVLVYFVVTTSIRLSLDQNSSSNKSGGGGKNNNNKVSDDDYYIDYDNYDYNNENGDDLFDGDDFVAGDDDAAAAGDDANGNDDGNAAGNDDQQQDANDDDGGRLFLRLF